MFFFFLNLLPDLLFLLHVLLLSQSAYFLIFCFCFMSVSVYFLIFCFCFMFFFFLNLLPDLLFLLHVLLLSQSAYFLIFCFCFMSVSVYFLIFCFYFMFFFFLNLLLVSCPPPCPPPCVQCLFVGCLKSQQHASVSQGRICSDNFTCCHTEIEVTDQTFHLTQSQYTDTGLTSPSTDPITPGAWQGSHWSTNFEVTGMTRPRKNLGASESPTRDLPLSRRTP